MPDRRGVGFTAQAAFKRGADTELDLYIRQLWVAVRSFPSVPAQIECPISKLSSNQPPLSFPIGTPSLLGTHPFPIIAIAPSHLVTSRVDIQHLTIPAALFTDAVDPEWVLLASGGRSLC